MHLPTSLCACLPKRSYETSAVFMIPKDGFFAIPSTQQMVNRPVLFHEKLHRYQQNLCEIATCQYAGLVPFHVISLIRWAAS